MFRPKPSRVLKSSGEPRATARRVDTALRMLPSAHKATAGELDVAVVYTN